LSSRCLNSLNLSVTLCVSTGFPSPSRFSSIAAPLSLWSVTASRLQIRPACGGAAEMVGIGAVGGGSDGESLTALGANIASDEAMSCWGTTKIDKLQRDVLLRRGHPVGALAASCGGGGAQGFQGV
jgi:hypothetical protein